MRKKSDDPVTHQEARQTEVRPGEEPWTGEDELARDRYIQETSGDRGRSLESEDAE